MPSECRAEPGRKAACRSALFTGRRGRLPPAAGLFLRLYHLTIGVVNRPGTQKKDTQTDVWMPFALVDKVETHSNSFQRGILGTGTNSETGAWHPFLRIAHGQYSYERRSDPCAPHMPCTPGADLQWTPTTGCRRSSGRRITAFMASPSFTHLLFLKTSSRAILRVFSCKPRLISAFGGHPSISSSVGMAGIAP